MYRFLFFLLLLIVPAIFGWWLFVPLSLLCVFLVKFPFEIILAGFFLDSVYYFGNSFWQKYYLTFFSIILLVLALFLSKRVHWDKRI